MVVLTVNSNEIRLSQLVTTVKMVLPDATVLSEQSPMAAGECGMKTSVDILFAEYKMTPLNGLQVAHYVRRANPNARVYLTGRGEDFFDDAFSAGKHYDGVLFHPIKEEDLRLFIK